MRHPGVPSFLQRTGTLVCLLLIGAGAAFAGEGQLSSDDLELGWSGEVSGIHHWQVREHLQPAAGEWQSLVSKTGPDQIVSRHLDLETVGAISWLPDAVSSETRGESRSISRGWISADGLWRLTQSVQHAGIPYRLDLVIELSRIADSRPSASSVPEIRLLLGPGLGEDPIEGLGIATSMYSYVDPVIQAGGKTERIELSEPGEAQTVSLPATLDETWFGLNSRYFALLLDPAEGTDVSAVEFRLAKSSQPNRLPSRYLPALAAELDVPELAAGEAVRWQFRVFSGPKSRAALAGEPGTSDYTGLLFHSLWNWMRGLSFGLMRVLEWLHAFTISWGLAICLLAVLVRLLLYPLARWALSSQQEFSEVQRLIQPKMARIKKKYKGEEQSERILKLYEKHGVSPLAGLKPLLIVLIQIPVFVALFHLLGQAFELRQASFLWMESLAEPDRLFEFGAELPFFGAYFNLLPVLMAVSTLITIKLSPAPASSDADRRRQNIVLGLMALAFFLLFYPFPSGMVLYWTIANALHIVQARIAISPSGNRNAA